MTQECQKKNFYFLNTMLNELDKYDIVSFNIFDTLILRNVLFPHDIIKLLANEVNIKYGIKDFNYVRMNIEQEVRNRTIQQDGSKEDISLTEVYEEIAVRYPELPVKEIMNMECELEISNSTSNPLIKKLFEAAHSLNKTVLLLADTIIPQEAIVEILKQNSITGQNEIYLSSELKMTESTGSVFRYIISKGYDAAKWLHISSNLADINEARTMGLTAGFFRTPRDWFFMERAKKHSDEEAKSGSHFPEAPLPNDLDFSRKTAIDINKRFTDVSPCDSDVVISAENISMMFNMSKEKVDNLKEYVIRFLKRQLKFTQFWALCDVNFEVNKGERVGLIGLNGSGKSTMLKIVSGVLSPTKGTVNVKGRVAPMIELGAGFDIELSARENVYLNGAILGYNHEEMEKYYDSIISFAELEDFQDVAIKNFSSGMISRLGFAIATCRVPDVLIIDEILSVGDFEFQKKCHERMKQLTANGTTVLFVSHSAGDIINMCDRAVWLDHGKVIAEGEAQYIVEKYLNK